MKIMHGTFLINGTGLVLLAALSNIADQTK
jgi:hypothetical protein